MKYITLIIIGLLAGVGCQTHKYEVHLINGTHHLITADSEAEAEEFMRSQEDSHGTMVIIKAKD
jgi:hypothetical protein